jgi:hypothetical protein
MEAFGPGPVENLATVWRQPALGVAFVHAVAASASLAGCRKTFDKPGKNVAWSLTSFAVALVPGQNVACICESVSTSFTTSWDGIFAIGKVLRPVGNVLRQEVSWQGFRASVRKTL